MQRFNIYLSGAISGLPAHGEDGYMTWRREIKDRIKEEFYSKIYDVNVIDPTEYFNFEELNHISEREIMEFELHKVRKSDLILVNFNKPDSLGTMAELATAYERRIPIIGYWQDDENPHVLKEALHAWLKEMCQRIFCSMDEMLEYVAKYYLN